LASRGRARTWCSRNVVSDHQPGIYVDTDVAENTFRGNALLRNRIAGIYLSDIGYGIIDNRFVANRATQNLGDGLWSDIGTDVGGYTRTVIERNVFELNSDDGLDVDGPNNVVAQNSANRNGDLGIEAHPGVTDGGGNTARDNGNPAQCLNVRCR
jgi:Periplasmic copper-binding protein (NosD)